MWRRIVFLFAVVLCAGQQGPAPEHASHAKHHEHSEAHEHPRTVEGWVKVLEDPDRDAWQKPEEVIERLGLQKGQAAADIGAGTGYFSVRMARAVGSEGKVFAVDIDPQLIEYLEERAQKAGLENLVAVLGAADDPRLEAESVDLVLIVNVIHHITGRENYYPKLLQALKPGGRLVLIDFYKKEAPVGPPVSMKIAKQDIIGEIQQAGFRLTEEASFLPYQYFLVFEPLRPRP